MSDCTIIGVLDSGPSDLNREAVLALRNASLVVGNARTLALFQNEMPRGCETRDFSAGMTLIPAWVTEAAEQGKRTVVLATGDPLCHGVGKYLVSKLGREKCQILPNTSVLQLAFARLGLAWQGARICSVHGKNAGEWYRDAGPEHGLYALLREIRKGFLLGVFTSADNSPDRIARMLHRCGLGGEYEISVAERLLLPEERVHDFLPAEEIIDRTYADPNVVILRPCHERRGAILFALNDSDYIQRKPERGLITKREVRAVSLGELGLRPDSIVWDIGAGSGSVGLEAARLCPDGFVFAIEKNEADAKIVRENQAKFRITNYRLIEARAPATLEQWPDPDAIFIGGSGGQLETLIDLSLIRLKEGGRLVMNFITFENLQRAMLCLRERGASWGLSQLQIARSKPLLDMQRLDPLTPVWVVTAQKEAAR